MITQISLDMFFCVVCSLYCMFFLIFFFNDTATTEIYTLSLHDALPISREIDEQSIVAMGQFLARYGAVEFARVEDKDRKSTRLNSSHTVISYAVFCLKKKKNKNK